MLQLKFHPASIIKRSFAYALDDNKKKEDIPLGCPAEPRGLGAKDDIEGDWLKQLAVATPSPLERVGVR